MLSKRLLRRLLTTGLVLFGLANVIVFFHAWQLTHFSAAAGPRTKSPEKLSAAAKLGLVLTGVRNPRPVTRAPPAFPYQSVFLRAPTAGLRRGTACRWARRAAQ